MNLKDPTLRRRRSSISGESHRDAYSGAAMDGTVSFEKLPGNISGNILDQKGTFWNDILPIMCVIGISVDPFFLFVPFVDDTKKCIGFDKRLGSTVIFLRFVFDLLYFRYIGNRTRRRFLLFIDVLAILPLSKMVISILTPAEEGFKLLHTIQFLKLFVIFQFVTRFIAIYVLVADKFDRATLTRAAFNLFLFMLAGHVFGSFWYFFAIQREIECWEEACLSHTGCGRGSFYCGDKLGDNRFLNGFCPTKTRDTTIYDFGIFYDALQSGVVEAIDFPQKFLHCFLWGLKTLSSFGSNLQLSGNGFESFFATLIIVAALVLFFLFIGNIQAYLQSEVVRSETLRSLNVQELEKQMFFEMHSKDIQKQSKNERSEEAALAVQEIEEWIPFQKLSNDLQNQVMIYRQFIYRKTKDINMENLLNNLPKGITRNIKRELCLELLKKVGEFKNLHESTLDELCDCLKPASYKERTLILEVGEPVHGMYFLLRGTVLRYSYLTSDNLSSKDRAAYSEMTEIAIKSGKVKNLVHGDFFGEELLTSALYDSSLPFIKSTYNIETFTNVEAFVLMVDDLKNVFEL